MPSEPLTYATRPPLRRRVWRRVRLPLLVVSLLAALLLARPAWRRADRWLVDREIARWRQYDQVIFDRRPDWRSDAVRAEAIRHLRATVAGFERELPAGLGHRDPRVRDAAANAAYMAASQFARYRLHRLAGDEPLFTAPIRAAIWQRCIAEMRLNSYTAQPLLYTVQYSATDDAGPIDLRPAIEAWPNLSATQQEGLIDLVHQLGPQTPLAGDLLLLASQTPTPAVRYALGQLVWHWFSPWVLALHEKGSPMGYWRMPDDREIMDPVAAVEALGGDQTAPVPMGPLPLAVVGHFGPRAGGVAVKYLPALDATAAQESRLPPQRAFAATAIRAIRAANNLPQPATRPAP